MGKIGENFGVALDKVRNISEVIDGQGDGVPMACR